jgi:hypothetical protein
MEIADPNAIEKWAYSKALDDEFSRYEDEHPEVFEHEIASACGLEGIFRFAADSGCLKRKFFANLLIESLYSIYATPELPYHFSRLQGLMSRDSFLKKEIRRAEVVYERAEFVEKMRVSQDPALRAFADVILDHRSNMIVPDQERRYELLRLLQVKVLPLFVTA